MNKITEMYILRWPNEPLPEAGSQEEFDRMVRDCLDKRKPARELGYTDQEHYGAMVRDPKTGEVTYEYD